MKINLTLDVSDGTRLIMAKSVPGGARSATAKGLASRQVVLEFIQARLRAMNDASEWITAAELTEIEKNEASDAIDYLKKAGKSDSEIRSWLLKQRARAQFTHTQLNAL